MARDNSTNYSVNDTKHQIALTHHAVSSPHCFLNTRSGGRGYKCSSDAWKLKTHTHTKKGEKICTLD